MSSTTTTTTVRLMVYDLSHGMLSQFAPQIAGILGGLRLDIIPHTGVEVFGLEYFYGGGIQRQPHSRVVETYRMRPHRIDTIGTTRKTKEELEAFITSLQARFSVATYNVFTNNCNHFSNELTKFLCGTGVPDDIVSLPQRVLNSPLGAFISPMFDQMNTQMAEHIPFNQQPSPSQELARETRIQYKLTGDETIHHVLIPRDQSMITINDMMIAIATRTSYRSHDIRIIFRGQSLDGMDGNKLLREISGLLNTDSIVHVVPKPNSKLKVKRTLVEALKCITNTPNKPAESMIALTTLFRLVDNVTTHPHEAKYRTVRLTNAVFAQSLGRIDGGLDALEALGFQQVSDTMTLPANGALWDKLLMGKRIIVAARKEALKRVLNSGNINMRNQLLNDAGCDEKDPFVQEVVREMSQS
jgi:hypothetical protein